MSARLDQYFRTGKADYQNHRRITEVAAAAATKQVNTLDLDLRTELSARWEHVRAKGVSTLDHF
jgi:hypothetical protein